MISKKLIEYETRMAARYHGHLQHIVLEANDSATYLEDEHELLEDGDDIVIVPNSFEEVDVLRMEAQRLHVSEHHIWWSAAVRHGDEIIETISFTWDQLLGCPVHMGKPRERMLCLFCVARDSR